MITITCKCGGDTYQDHVDKCATGYPGHTYKGTDRDPLHDRWFNPTTKEQK